MGRRPGGRYRDPQRTKGLDVSTFFIEDGVSIPNTPDDFQSIYTHIASLPLSLESAGLGSAGPEQRVGQVLSSGWRSMVVSGLAFDWGIEQQSMDGDNGATIGEFWWCFQVISDRVVIDVGTGVPIPASLSHYNPFRNTWPTAILSTTSPGVDTDEARFPTRIHFSHTELFNGNANRIDNTQESVLYYPNGQKVAQRQSTFNRRLRVRLDEGHGLFFAWSFLTGRDFFDVNTTDLRRWARGQLYYRVR